MEEKNKLKLSKASNLIKIDTTINHLEDYFVSKYFMINKITTKLKSTTKDNIPVGKYAHIRYKHKLNDVDYTYARITTAVKVKWENKKPYYALTIPRTKPNDYTIWSNVDELIIYYPEYKSKLEGPKNIYHVKHYDAKKVVDLLNNIDIIIGYINKKNNEMIHSQNYYADSQIPLAVFDTTLISESVINMDEGILLSDGKEITLEEVIEAKGYTRRLNNYTLSGTYIQKPVEAWDVVTLQHYSYKSLRDASKDLQIKESLISHVINGRQKTAKNKVGEKYTFFAEEEIEKINNMSVEDKRTYFINKGIKIKKENQ